MHNFAYDAHVCMIIKIAVKLCARIYLVLNLTIISTDRIPENLNL